MIMGPIISPPPAEMRHHPAGDFTRRRHDRRLHRRRLLGEPGPRGLGVGRARGPLCVGREAHTTNQRMEITAALEAVRALEGRLEVVSDSTYVVNCFRDRWYEGWLKRGLEELEPRSRSPTATCGSRSSSSCSARGDVTFRWVKGHTGDPMNDLVDRLAVEAALDPGGPDRGGRARRTSDRPTTSAAAATGGGRATVACPPAGSCWSPATAPTELGGYDANPVADGVRHRLAGDPGRDGRGRRAAHRGERAAARAPSSSAPRRRSALGLPLVAVLPVSRRRQALAGRRRAPGSPSWSAAADAAITLETKSPATKQLAGAALARRDAWLAKQVDSAVVVWDQEDDVVGRAGALAGGPPRADQVLLVHP